MTTPTTTTVPAGARDNWPLANRIYTMGLGAVVTFQFFVVVGEPLGWSFTKVFFWRYFGGWIVSTIIRLVQRVRKHNAKLAKLEERREYDEPVAHLRVVDDEYGMPTRVSLRTNRRDWWQYFRSYDYKGQVARGLTNLFGNLNLLASPFFMGPQYVSMIGILQWPNFVQWLSPRYARGNAEAIRAGTKANALKAGKSEAVATAEADAKADKYFSVASRRFGVNFIMQGLALGGLAIICMVVLPGHQDLAAPNGIPSVVTSVASQLPFQLGLATLGILSFVIGLLQLTTASFCTANTHLMGEAAGIKGDSAAITQWFQHIPGTVTGIIMGLVFHQAVLPWETGRDGIWPWQGAKMTVPTEWAHAPIADFLHLGPWAFITVHVVVAAAVGSLAMVAFLLYQTAANTPETDQKGAPPIGSIRTTQLTYRQLYFAAALTALFGLVLPWNSPLGDLLHGTNILVGINYLIAVSFFLSGAKRQTRANTLRAKALAG